MQLVKNLYLTRQKTIARKLEEMIITWLIEENRLIAKERMYRNLSEHHRMGAGDQRRAGSGAFLFRQGRRENLTLAEAIFMASIIPRPNRFMYSFDEDLSLRPWLKAYYGDVSRKMLRREMIEPAAIIDALVPEVRLKGPARLLLKDVGSAPDSLSE